MTFDLHLESRPNHSPLPSWSKPYALGVGVVKQSFSSLKDSVKYAQTIVNTLIHPKHLNVVHTSVQIPRRIGRDKSLMKAEYLDWSPSKGASQIPKEKECIILFAHGGAFTVGKDIYENEMYLYNENRNS